MRMTGTVAQTWLYPIKGMHGIRMKKRGIMAHTTLGVQGDRNFAAYRRAGGAPENWKPKGQFYVCMNREDMATSHGLIEKDVDETYRVDPGVVMEIMEEHGLPVGEMSFLDTKGKRHNADTNKPYVSILNLASVRDLEQWSGKTIDPRRFRMNIAVDGVPAWKELEHVTAFEQGERFPMWIHDVELYADDLCERCKATEQSPSFGKWDLETLDLLNRRLEELGYKGSPHRGVRTVMGWLTIPQNNGLIREGHQLSFNIN